MTSTARFATGDWQPEELDPAATDTALAAALVRNAGELALRVRSAGGLAEHRKTNIADIVTSADTAAEAYVTAQLRRCRPDDGILGEEGASAASNSGRVWVIDPVDGTYNFASGSTYWCSALALAEIGSGEELASDAEVLLGAVYQPQEDSLWIGGSDLPTTRNGAPATAATGALETSSIASYLHPPYFTDPDVAAPFTRSISAAATVRMLGSGSCDLARVADGRLGCWLQHSTALWDWLPGKALVRAAGGDTDVVHVNGYRWHLAGSTAAVARLRELLSVPSA